MTDTTLPAPLVPPEVDLRGLKYMPLLGGRLFGSDFDLDANDAEFRVGLRLWWAAWNQVPAGSLPAEDHRIRGLAGLAENPAKWKKVRERALNGFIECADGRLYHPIVAEQALIAWEKRAEDIEERANENDRQRRLRDDRKRMFAELRAVGITAKWDIGTTELRTLHKEHVTSPVTPPETRTGDGPVTVTSTAKTGRDVTGIKETGGRAKAAAPAPSGPPPEANGHQPTPAGAICRAMKAAGLQAVNPGDPRLLELIRQGATTAEFEGLAAEAADKGKGFAWVLTVLQARRKEAGEIALSPKADVRSTTVPSAETVEQYQARMAAERAASREGITKPPAAALALAGKLRVP